MFHGLRRHGDLNRRRKSQHWLRFVRPHGALLAQIAGTTVSYAVPDVVGNIV